MKKYPYSYAVLQYHHDTWVGEALNVGVLLYCEEARFLQLRSRTARGRLAKAYPSINHGAFRLSMKALERRFDRISSTSGLLMPSSRALEVGKTVLREDDSSLQWGFSGVGITDNPDVELDKHYQRFVSQHDIEQVRESRSDEAVFETIRRKLEKAEVFHLMESHTVRSEFATVTFDHAFRNGTWHCIQPLSFDSADEDRMLSKAAKWVGIMQSIASREADIRPYFVTGAPQKECLLPQYCRMVDFLRSSPMTPVVVDEHDSGKIVDSVSQALHS